MNQGLSNLERFEMKYIPEPNSGCFLWTATAKDGGYGSFYMREYGRVIGSHRAAWEIYRGAIPGGLHVLHRCDNKLCVNPDHLWLGTDGDNMRDAAKKGFFARKPGDVRAMPKGEDHYRTKLTWDDVRYIRSCNLTQQELADHYGVTFGTISKIRLRTTWREVAS